MQMKESHPENSSENISSEVQQLLAATKVQECLPFNHPQDIVREVNLPERHQGRKLVSYQHGDLITAQYQDLEIIIASQEVNREFGEVVICKVYVSESREVGKCSF